MLGEDSRRKHDRRPRDQENFEINKNEDGEWIQFGLRLGVTTALHPFEYAKVLMQIGFEPIAPVPGRSLFGRPTLVLPNVFRYVGYIKRVDGFSGCFRGLSAKVVGIVLSSHFSERVADGFGLEPLEQEEDSKKRSPTEEWEREDDDKKSLIQFKKQLKRGIVVHTAGVFISQPFHVISIRMMAQFVGREKLYDGLWQSIKEIWSQEGIFGFFSGFIPRLFCDLGILILSSSATFLATRFLVDKDEYGTFVSNISQFVASSMFYPYSVVSSTMIVNGTRLKAGQFPAMEPYRNWKDCYGKLKAAGEHKRGSSLFFRYVPRPSKSAANGTFAPYPDVKY